MKRILIYFLLGFLGAFASVATYAQAVQYKRAEGYLPDIITVKRSVPDTGRICIEPPDGGMVNCRLVGDLRKWAQQRAGK